MSIQPDRHCRSEVRTFEDQPDVILHVGFVKAKPDVFIDEIQYLLVLSTSSSLILLGVASTPNVSSQNTVSRLEVRLYDTEFSIPSREMQSICGTKDGRIFMCGTEDGYLYELVYRSNEGWFNSKITLVCHSTSRGLSGILPVSLPAWGLVPNTNRARGDTITLRSTMKSIVADVNRIVPSEPFSIIALHIIKRSTRGNDSDQPQLMAVTSSGARLYFSKQRYMMGADADSLHLSHVRLPPQNLRPPVIDSTSTRGRGYVSSMASSSPATFQVGRIEGSFSSLGITLERQPPGDDPEKSDSIVCLSPDFASICSLGITSVPHYTSHISYPTGSANNSRTVLTEYATVMTISGNAWDMCEVPLIASSKRPPEGLPFVITNELITQFSEPQRKFLIIANTGLNLIIKRRAVDFLNASLVEADLGNQAPLQDFFTSFGRDQTCAMLFALASGNTFLTLDGSQTTSLAANNAKAMLFTQSGKPTFKEGVSFGGSTVEGNIIFSGRYMGLAFYLARLIRPIWRASVVIGEDSQKLVSNVNDSTLVTTQKNLDCLRNFMSSNPHLFDSSQSDLGSGTRTTAEQEAWKIESTSASALNALVSQTIEAISFVLLLQDYGLSHIANLCDPQILKKFLGLQYRDLVTTKEGRDVARALVTVVINQQIAQQTSVCTALFSYYAISKSQTALQVDTISEVLQSRCGSFCSMDDVKYFKAQESLRKASETHSAEERARCLHESLKCSQEFDASNEGRDYWLQGCPGGDSDPRKQAYDRRRACYQICVDSLSDFDSRLSDVIQKGRSIDEAEAARTRAYQLAFESQDQIFHSFFYDWLINRGMTEELLQYRPPFLEEHLQRKPRTLDKLDFLWQYFVKTEQPFRAATVLANIAETLEFDLSLDKRIEYLTLAANNAKSHSNFELRQYENVVEIQTDIDEKLEVAQVQREILHALYAKFKEPKGEIAASLRRLESELLNITQLYNDYVEPHDLHTCKLLIFKVSDHRDTRLTRSTWESLIAESRMGATPQEQMSNVSAIVSLLASRFFPSEAAFPLDEIALLLEKLALETREYVPYGWAPRTLTSGSVPYGTVFDTFHSMYESQVPPFNKQEAVQFLSSDIAVLIADWLDATMRPQSRISRGEFPANILDEAVSQYIRELDPQKLDTRKLYEDLRIRIRASF
ncbi:hypothetical protein Clacol_003667 [Clathrus columnatus]|uniref:Uncharacterized protein n=1 Tax=Clathrus columnatus TaxID=1419009 RepID=A0AAV5A9N3_9AGAM|nr:hypothetical protein Clacol_003667 [Clathrus columnatus]